MIRATRHFLAPLILAVSLVAAAGPAIADRDHWRDHGPRGDQGPRQGERGNRLISLPEVLGILHAHFSGDMIGRVMGPDQSSPYPVYRVMWLTAEGRRLDITVDARTGQILSVSG